jgi:riboflavin kinase/FMN adenylyltransferase
MQHVYGLKDAKVNGACLSIGSFDGVHLGHQKIIKKLIAAARESDVPAVVLTFYPHPSVVLRGPRESFYISMPEEKAALLGELGIDLVITYPFDEEVSLLRAEEFIGHLHQHLGIKQLWIGYDFSLGRDREGNLPVLEEIGENLGFSVHEVSALSLADQVVSSSRIRRLVEAGEVEQSAHLLGRSFALRGQVTSGEERGRKLGIRTANFAIPSERVVPGAGVYACLVTHQGKTYQAVTNVGVRPTFELEPVPPRVEAHLLNFEGDLYGEELTMSFEARLRGERRFSSAEALVERIKVDIQKAQEVLSNKK